MLRHTQIINEIDHRKTLKDNNHTVILTNAEKVLNKMWHFFMIKVLEEKKGYSEHKSRQ